MKRACKGTTIFWIVQILEKESAKKCKESAKKVRKSHFFDIMVALQRDLFP